MKRIGAVDIGGTKIAVGIVSADGVILHREECPTNAERGFPDAIHRIQKMLQQAIDTCGSIEGIGIGCPGPLDPTTGVIGNVGTLPSWENGCLAEKIATHFNLSVAVENDADAATLAEYAWGTEKTSGTLIYITISTGIGGGIVHNGQLYRGTHGAHPEFGHQVIDSIGPSCYCGLKGCWESLASGPAMGAWLREISPESGMQTAVQICEGARQKDALALRVIEREAHYIGMGLVNLITMFAPDVVCLGGGVMKSSDLFLPDVLAIVQRYCTQVPMEKIKITLSSLGPDIGLLGAAKAWMLRNSQD